VLSHLADTISYPNIGIATKNRPPDERAIKKIAEGLITREDRVVLSEVEGVFDAQVDLKSFIPQLAYLRIYQREVR